MNSYASIALVVGSWFHRLAAGQDSYERSRMFSLFFQLGPGPELITQVGAS